MTWIVNVFLLIFYTSITGTIMFLIWELANKIFHQRDNIVYTYYGLKVIAFSFVVPILAVLLFLQYYRNGVYSSWAFASTVIIQRVITALSLIWLIGVAVTLLTYARQGMRLEYIKKASVICDNQKMKIFCECCQELGIKRKIRVREAFLAKVPFITGIIHPTICIPIQKFKEDELRVVFIHELMHYLHKDALLKKAMTFVVCVQWFYPLVRHLFREINEWSESYCDLDCCDYFGDKKKYFGILIEFSIQDKSRWISYMTSTLYESKKGIQGRVIRMSNYKNVKNKSKKLAGVVVASLALIGSCTALAAGNQASKLYEEIVLSTQEVGKAAILDSAELEEHTGFWDKSDATLINVNPFERAQCVFPLAPGRSAYTYPRTLEAGTKIALAGNMTPMGSSAKIGIVDALGNVNYIEIGGTSYSHTFQVRFKGSYSVFATNLCDHDITITCSYYY